MRKALAFTTAAALGAVAAVALPASALIGNITII